MLTASPRANSTHVTLESGQDRWGVVSVTLHQPSSAVDFTVLVNVPAVNDPPTAVLHPLAIGGAVALEDAGEQTFGPLFSVLTAGPYEDEQTVAVTVQDRGSLCSASVRTGYGLQATLAWRACPNANGNSSVILRVADGVGAYIDVHFLVRVEPVNDPPQFSLPDRVQTTEDHSATVNVTSVVAGPAEESQSQNVTNVTARVTSDSLGAPAFASVVCGVRVSPPVAGFPFVGPATVQVNVQPCPNAHGSAVVHVTADDGASQFSRGFELVVHAVNDPPTLELAVASVQLFEDHHGAAPPAVFAGIIQAVSGGPPDEEATQTVNIEAAVSGIQVPGHVAVEAGGDAALFASPPTVRADGALEFTLSPDAYGSADLLLTAVDSGGARSAAQPLRVRVAAVNDPPFMTVDHFELVEDSGETAWPAVASAGAASESRQTLSFSITSVAVAGGASHEVWTELFASPPAVSADGTLSFAPAAHAFGTVSVAGVLSDSGGDGQSPAQRNVTFTVAITPVNDPPVCSATDIHVRQNSSTGPVTWPSHVRVHSTGDPFERGQHVSVQLTRVSVEPEHGRAAVHSVVLRADGNLTLALVSPFAHGTTGVRYVCVDDGNPAAVSAEGWFDVVVENVNDAPTLELSSWATSVNVSSGAAFHGSTPRQVVVEGVVASVSAGEWEAGLQDVVCLAAVQAQSAFGADVGPLALGIPPTLDCETGQLTLWVLPGANGSATLQLWAADSGGFEHVSTILGVPTVVAYKNGGVNVSARSSITVQVLPERQPPSVSQVLATVEIPCADAADTGGWINVTVPGLVRFSGAAPANLTRMSVSTHTPTVLSNPRVTSDGSLALQLACSRAGETQVAVHDEAGSVEGGLCVTPCPVVLTVYSVNDCPAFKTSTGHLLIEPRASGTVTLVAGFATNATAGAFENVQRASLGYHIVVTRDGAHVDPLSLFSVPPAIAVDTGDLLLWPLDSTNTVVTLGVTLFDGFGTTRGGCNASAVHEIVVDIHGVPSAAQVRA